ncbi:sensor histidine kinase [Pseudobacteriovorax antillogorgiicola]|uniref:histidine kinase n=1 Tax=Pseudobacteriovorax antillogorgiicola TaxID=1513793 RepID=A0A1Y6CR73_9BACT|nr:HAMP domain-containing sensor histidine kinase [Pseudobacteriovorax antillogorgiicola]TCS46727.1 phospho-acceptor domain-containing protein [Pseudobacteriovorax antillogorgiicola]SMF67162.1 His Kinase A (phospho-acceptor) domain-containing protein [Pseudobacteriovorax antillogorgiicola]
MLGGFKKNAISILKRLTHPIVVFVALQVVWISFVVLWVVWFLNQKETLAQLSKLMGTTPITGTTGIMTLVIGCILLGMILVGTVVLFIFTQVQGSLLRQQKSFVSSVTHELRSPLASLQLSFETLQRPNLPDRIQTKVMGMVERDLERLTQLVDRILLSARLDRGILDYTTQLETFHLKEAILKCVDRAAHMDRHLKNRLTIICPEHMKVRGIRLAFTMIFGNLLENAVKYSPKDSLIEVCAKRQDRELWLSVKDQGFGLNKRDQRKVFHMFHRTPRATKNAVPGTGLGLYIVRSMVRGLGGRIWVESEGVGKGSTFYVAFPADVVISRDQSY